MALYSCIYKDLVIGYRPSPHTFHREIFSRSTLEDGQRADETHCLAVLLLNFCMFAIVLGISGWAINHAINHGFIIGPGFNLPAHFSPIYFPMGNAATGFFVTFSLIAGVVGIASIIAGGNHLRAWNADSLPSAVSAAAITWSLTLLAMGFAWKEIDLHIRNVKLRTMEAFIIILSVSQLLYIVVIYGGFARRL